MTRALSDDWERMYGHPVYFAETFIDPGRFRGTCYRAANWQLLGLTTGRGKNDQTNKPNRPIKEILGLPLTPRFREYPQPVMTMRRRIDVNLDELDQIIDRSTRAPLSESEGQKLKTALHAMAERLLPKRSTEKTSAVLPQDAAPADKPDTGESAPAGHGRNGAAAFTGADRVAVAHATLHPGDTARNAAREKCTARRNRQRWCGSWGTHRWKRPCSRWSDCAATPAGRSSPPTNRRRRARKSTTRRPWR